MFEVVLAADYAALLDRVAALEAAAGETVPEPAPVVVTWTIETVTERAAGVRNVTPKMLARLARKLQDSVPVADAVEYATGSRTARRSLQLIDALS